MTYPRVIQFETRELEIEARARLARKRRAARAPKPAGDGWRRFMRWRSRSTWPASPTPRPHAHP